MYVEHAVFTDTQIDNGIVNLWRKYILLTFITGDVQSKMAKVKDRIKLIQSEDHPTVRCI